MVWLVLDLSREQMATGAITFKNRIPLLLFSPVSKWFETYFAQVTFWTFLLVGGKGTRYWIIMEQTHGYLNEYLGQDFLTWLPMAGIWYFELCLIYWKCWIPVFLKTGLYGHDLFWLLVVKLNTPHLNAVISWDNTKLLSKNTNVCVRL